MSFEPKFLTYDQVIEMHHLQIEEFGGMQGVRDEGLLISALAQPKSGFGDEYFHKDLYEMAAAYLFHLISNHPFYDGNKRIAALAAAVFLEVNGCIVIAEEDEFEKITLETAQGEKNKSDLAQFFKDGCKPKHF